MDGGTERSSDRAGNTPVATHAQPGITARRRMSVAGALTSAALSDNDLLLGRWDAAAIQLTAVDWSDPVSRS